MFGADGLQMIVDDDAAVDGDAGFLGKRRVRPDAGREHDGIGLDAPSIGKFDTFDLTLSVDTGRVGVEQDLDALALDQRLEEISGGRIELALHQPVHQMQQRYRRAGFREPIGRFQSQQAAADHDDRLLARRERQQQIDIAAVAEGVHAGKVGPGTLSRSGVEPVASTRRENSTLSSPAIFSSLRPTSISVARQPYFKVTPRSRHQLAGLSSISGDAISPASTEDNSTRL